MSELINLRKFIEERFKGHAGEREIIKQDFSQTPGVVLKSEEIYLSPYTPVVDFLYHQGVFVGFNPDFDNLKNLRKGYFGNPDGYTYLSSDVRVKPSRPLTDLLLKVDYSKLDQPLYRDPETFLEKYYHEWDRAFMIKGSIPKSAIVEVSFPEHMRFIPKLRQYGDKSLSLDQYSQRIEQLREEFSALF